MRIYFVRHGESEANVLNILYNRGAKCGLTDKGTRQVEELAAELSGVNFEKIYASPLLRAKQTAEILADGRRSEIETTGALREFDVGILDGTGSGETFEKEQELVDEWLLKKNWDAKIEGGESYNELKDRFSELFDSVKIKGYENVLLVGHGGIIQCMTPFVCENIGFETCHGTLLKNAQYVLMETDGEKTKCLKYGEWKGDSNT